MYADEGADGEAEFDRVCYPLYSATLGWAGESGQFLARMIKSPDVSSHYSHEFPRFDTYKRDRRRPVPRTGPHRRRRPSLPLPV